MVGWIKLHRNITSHWIFKDADKFKAWISILTTVNHSENKVILGEFAGIRLYVDKTNHNALKTYSSLGMNGEHYSMFEWMKDY